MIIQFSFAFSNELFNLYIFAALSELFPFWCPSFSFLFPNVLFNRSEGIGPSRSIAGNKIGTVAILGYDK